MRSDGYRPTLEIDTPMSFILNRHGDVITIDLPDIFTFFVLHIIGNDKTFCIKIYFIYFYFVIFINLF